ncbi:hypothetical protein PIB30_115875, partial [Stylosanthes scabra]|nr:hypothetical protein [Stylosanthes scabra]
QEKAGSTGSLSRKGPPGVIIAEETGLMTRGRMTGPRTTILVGGRQDTCTRSRVDLLPEDRPRAPGKGT